MENKSTSSDWFRTWFGNKAYLERYAHRDQNEARKAVASIVRRIPLQRKASVLDCACGSGRHLKFLEREFSTAIGIDLSRLLLAHGKRMNPEMNFIQSDIRNMPFKKGSFQCIFSLFTSFGYFDDESNMNVIHSWNEILESKGYIVVDTINLNHLTRNIQLDSVHTTENFSFIETREIRSKRIEKCIEVSPLKPSSHDSPVKRFRESVRIYELNELGDMLNRAGFTPIAVLGNYTGDDFIPDAESHDRMIFIAKKNS